MDKTDNLHRGLTGEQLESLARLRASQGFKVLRQWLEEESDQLKETALLSQDLHLSVRDSDGNSHTQVRPVAIQISELQGRQNMMVEMLRFIREAAARFEQDEKKKAKPKKK